MQFAIPLESTFCSEVQVTRQGLPVVVESYGNKQK
jgi:hypothetical protein